MKKPIDPLLKIAKESPEARKRRVSSGVKFRPVVIPNKKKRDVPPRYEEAER